jgi:hypothetical protein
MRLSMCLVFLSLCGCASYPHSAQVDVIAKYCAADTIDGESWRLLATRPSNADDLRQAAGPFRLTNGKNVDRFREWWLTSADGSLKLCRTESLRACYREVTVFDPGSISPNNERSSLVVCT